APNADSATSSAAETNLNQWYQSGDQAFILLSACLVLLMVPGIAFLYSGLARRKSALSMLWVVMMSFSVIVFQWYFWGFSLAFSPTSTNSFIGDMHHFGLKKRMMMNFRPHNISLITLGTILLWFGWLGFNGGSAFGANLRAVMACWNSCLTAMFAAMTWCLLDFRLARKWSMVGWCSGTISGLVAATPASGFIDPWASIILGVVAGVCCNFGTKIKFLVRIDDSLDVFAEHGIGGMVGLIFNAFFATKNVIGLDGVNSGTLGGFLDHKYATIGWQIAAIVTASAYAFVMSAIIAKLIDFIPGLKLRASEEAELLGMDDDQHGEFSYDYVEVRRDFLAWSPQTGEPAGEGTTIEPQHGIQEHASMVRPTSSSLAMAESKRSLPSSLRDHSDRDEVIAEGVEPAAELTPMREKQASA
ncbi:hypothetical protein LLEC1_00744, partial [Akanthomyces lecanii]